MCIATTPQRAAAHNSAIPASRNPEISLITSAPASSTAAATAAWRVSTEITASVHERSSRTTGSTLSNSSSAETSAAPGLVDSPYVQNKGSLPFKLFCMGDSAFRRIKTPSVGKGIRSNVHNSHQHASARHIQYVSPYKPVHLITFLSKPLYITLISQKLFFHHENNAPASLHPPAHDVRALASGQDDFNVQTASSRMVKHEDGSRSYFEKQGTEKG